MEKVRDFSYNCVLSKVSVLAFSKKLGKRKWILEKDGLIYKPIAPILLILLFTMPITAVLLTWIGVWGRGWPNSHGINWIILASFVLTKSALNSGSATETATNLRILQVIIILLLSCKAFPSVGKLLRKNTPLRDFYLLLLICRMHHNIHYHFCGTKLNFRVKVSW